MTEKDPYNAERWPLLTEAGVFSHADPRNLLDAVEAVLADRRAKQGPVKGTPVHSHRVVVLELNPFQTHEGRVVTTLRFRWTDTPGDVAWDAELLHDGDPAAKPDVVAVLGPSAAPWWVRELEERFRLRGGGRAAGGA